MSFTCHEIKNNTLGDILKQARLKLGLDVKDVEKKTNISVKYIEFLEANDFYKLPNSTYTRGSLCRYAEFLGLNSLEIVRQWKQDYDSFFLSSLGRSKRAKGFARLFRLFVAYLFNYGTGKKERAEEGARRIRILNPEIILISLVILLILFYLSFSIKRVLSSPQIEIISPLNDLVTKESALIIEGKTEPGVNVFINNQAVSQVEGYFKERVELLPGLNIIEISGKKKYSKKETIYRRVVLETNR